MGRRSAFKQLRGIHSIVQACIDLGKNTATKAPVYEIHVQKSCWYVTCIYIYIVINNLDHGDSVNKCK